ncbi:MAG: CvpA family protein [Lachnospiraceae bacterium]
MTWLGIVSIIIIVAFALVGLRRGFLKEVLSLAFIFIALLIAWLVNPYVNTFLTEQTPLYTYLQDSTSQVLKTEIGSATDLLPYEEATSNIVKMSSADTVTMAPQTSEAATETPAEAADTTTDAATETTETPQAEAADETTDGTSAQEEVAGAAAASVAALEAAIEKTTLPQWIKTELLAKVQDLDESVLSGDTVRTLLSGSIAEIILRAISYLLSFIIAIIIVMIIAAALDLVSYVPIVGTVNRLAGLCFGIIKGVILIWLLLFVLTILYSTSIGTAAAEMMETDPVLKVFNNTNIFTHFFGSIFRI